MSDPEELEAEAAYETAIEALEAEMARVHDPLCPATSRCTTCGCRRCECDLIASVRADQATTSFREGYNQHATAAALSYEMYGLPKGYSPEAAENRP